MTVTLYKFGPQWGVADPSPFCLKLESYLRLVGIDFKAPDFDLSFFKMAPKGKFPFIKSKNGEFLGDSNLIISSLIKQGKKDLDSSLTVEQKAISLAFQRLMDENLYWVLVYSRWKDEAGWNAVKDIFFSKVPKPLRSLIQKKERKKTLSKVSGHGMGLHTSEDIYAIGERDLQALSDYLGEKEYFFGGNSPTLIDLTLHAYIINFIEPPVETQLKRSALKKENLVRHAHHIQDMIYGSQEKAGKAA